MLKFFLLNTNSYLPVKICWYLTYWNQLKKNDVLIVQRCLFDFRFWIFQKNLLIWLNFCSRFRFYWCNERVFKNRHKCKVLCTCTSLCVLTRVIEVWKVYTTTEDIRGGMAALSKSAVGPIWLDRLGLSGHGITDP